LPLFHHRYEFTIAEVSPLSSHFVLFHISNRPQPLPHRQHSHIPTFTHCPVTKPKPSLSHLLPPLPIKPRENPKFESQDSSFQLLHQHQSSHFSITSTTCSLDLLRVMAGIGLDTDLIYTADFVQEDDIPEERYLCDRFVDRYLFRLRTYPQVIPGSACTGSMLYMRGSQYKSVTYTSKFSFFFITLI